MIPNLTKQELLSLEDIRRSNPIQFNRDMTTFFWNEHYNYVTDGRVWRVTISGETRSGKSEVGSTIMFNHQVMVNSLVKDNYFNKFDVFKEFNHDGLMIDVNRNICGNQFIYKKRQRELYKNNGLRFMDIFQIDESRSQPGGVGSMSEMIELENLNNIIAKFCQCEIWIKPTNLQVNNTPYGLQLVKKDTKNKINWCLLYKIMMGVSGLSFFKFLGWVHVPLHDNNQFRVDYNNLKNDWIKGEIDGQPYGRDMSRGEVAEMVSQKYPYLFEKTEGGKPIYSKAKKLVFVSRLIRKKIIEPLNEMEKYYVIEEAEMITDEKMRDDMIDIS